MALAASLGAVAVSSACASSAEYGAPGLPFDFDAGDAAMMPGTGGTLSVGTGGGAGTSGTGGGTLLDAAADRSEPGDADPDASVDADADADQSVPPDSAPDATPRDAEARDAEGG